MIAESASGIGDVEARTHDGNNLRIVHKDQVTSETVMSAHDVDRCNYGTKELFTISLIWCHTGQGGLPLQETE